MNVKSSVGCLTVVGALLMTTVAPATAHAAAPGVVPAKAAAAQPRTVTLVTGDRVLLPRGDTSRLVVRAGKGRDKVGFISQRAGKRISIMPSDALSLVQTGKLDRRLFDITTLLEFGYDDRRADLPLIITYGDAARAEAAGSPPGARAGRALPSVNGQAVRVSRAATGDFWQGMTATGQASTLRQGAAKVWLDGLRWPSLDESVPQIGAPAAWQAGFTGSGVTVAVLDTGIDATHPDLAGRVVKQRNFTEDPDNRDLVGHGTHVASTIAGSGKASNGRYKGVATGAKLLDGKVCGIADCTESAILGGMEWAAQNAEVINMSLGRSDTPEIDPLEQAVNTLSAQHHTLFVVAAGNIRPGESTVSSPGSADAALTAGAVDKSDELADFSRRGPRVGDGAIKPDITAPGVDISAARSKDGQAGEPGQSYVSMDGTSMATPHVAGAAAIVAQRRPEWTGAQVKSALMGTAKPHAGLGVFEQGAGRVDVAQAVTHIVTAAPASVSFGVQAWPHGDDKPIKKTLTYHNAGTAAVTLDLAMKTTGPGGQPTPAGMFALSAPKLTVPAGGDGTVTVTADTSVAGPDGVASGYVTATAAGRVVRTPLAVNKEIESYNLTLTHNNRAGQPPEEYSSTHWDYKTGYFDVPVAESGQVTMRLPRARYLLASVLSDSTSNGVEMTHLVQPVVNLTKDQTIALDARRAKPVSITVPRPKARSAFTDVSFTMTVDGNTFGVEATAEGTSKFFTAQIGKPKAVPGLASMVNSVWADPSADDTFRDSPVAYTLSWYDRGRFFTGFRRDVKPQDLATVQVDFAQHAISLTGARSTWGIIPQSSPSLFTAFLPFRLPFKRTEYYNTDNRGVHWEQEFYENMTTPEGMVQVGAQVNEPATYQPEKAYRAGWNTATFGPVFPTPRFPADWVSRSGDTITAFIPLFGDAALHAGFSEITGAKTTLFGNGEQIAESPAAGAGEFTVPKAAAQYRLETAAERGTPFSLSTRLSAAWTFRSGHAGGDSAVLLPLSVLRFTPGLDSRNTAPAGQRFTLPVSVQRQPGSKAAHNKKLTVDVSYNDGRTWQSTVLSRASDGTWTAALQHPAKAGFVSLRAAATDTAGNTVEQTIIRAYRIAPMS